jgi:hypothetical protein
MPPPNEPMTTPTRKSTLLERLQGGQTLYTLRYKYVRGITTTLILASGQEKAEAVGRAWVNSQPGRTFLSVEASIVADESILAGVTPEVVGAGGRR